MLTCRPQKSRQENLCSAVVKRARNFMWRWMIWKISCYVNVICNQKAQIFQTIRFIFVSLLIRVDSGDTEKRLERFILIFLRAYASLLSTLQQVIILRNWTLLTNLWHAFLPSLPRVSAEHCFGLEVSWGFQFLFGWSSPHWSPVLVPILWRKIRYYNDYDDLMIH